MSILWLPSKWIKPSTLSWIILTLATINVIFLGGKRKSFGAFVAQWHKDFRNITLMELNWIGNSYAAFGNLLSGVTTLIILYIDRRYLLFQWLGAILILLSCVSSSFVPNPHWLFITHTLLHGIGSAFILSITSLIVIEYFDSNHPYRILATSLVSGASIATIVFVPLFAYLIQQFNWRNTFLILGLIYFVVNGSSAFFFKPNDTINDMDGKKYNFRLKNIKCPQIPLMVLWFVDKTLSAVVMYGLLMNLTDYLYRNQTNLVRSSLLTTIFASGEAVAFIIIVLVTAISRTFLKGRIGLVQILAGNTICVSLIVMDFMKNFMTIERFLCFMAGLGMGLNNSLTYPASEELTKLPAHISNMFSLFGIGCGTLVSPLLSATIAEIFQYKWFFFIQGILSFGKVICLGSMMTLLWFYDKYDINIEYEDEPELVENSVNDISELEDETTKLI